MTRRSRLLLLLLAAAALAAAAVLGAPRTAAARLERAGLPGGAERLLRFAVRGGPDDPRLASDLHDLMKRRGRLREEAAFFEALERARPESPWAPYWVGRAHAELGELPRAAESFRRAAAMGAANEGVARNSLGYELQRMGRLEEALRELEAAERLSEPGDRVYPAVNRAIVLARLGRAEEARARLRETEARYGADPRAAGAYWAKRALAEERLADREAALASAARALARGRRVVQWIDKDPASPPLRADPRYRALLEASGRP